MRRLAEERARLFDQQAECYDRCRPTYPAAVIDDLLGPEPSGLDVLDVGCGTGIASRQMAERGANVLGVEVAPRMAEIARTHGVDVEVAAFEDWDAAGRTYDRIVSAQAWHWLDLPVSTAKAASLLRPGGRLCLLWSAGCHPDDLADALAEIYARLFPNVGSPGFGYAASRPSDRRSGLTSVHEAIAAEPKLAPATEEWFPWTREYDRAKWLDVLLSRSDHAALDAAGQRAPLRSHRRSHRRPRRLVRNELRDRRHHLDPARIVRPKAAPFSPRLISNAWTSPPPHPTLISDSPQESPEEPPCPHSPRPAHPDGRLIVLQSIQSKGSSQPDSRPPPASPHDPPP